MASFTCFIEEWTFSKSSREIFIPQKVLWNIIQNTETYIKKLNTNIQNPETACTFLLLLPTSMVHYGEMLSREIIIILSYLFKGFLKESLAILNAAVRAYPQCQMLISIEIMWRYTWWKWHEQCHEKNMEVGANGRDGEV